MKVEEILKKHTVEKGGVSYVKRSLFSEEEFFAKGLLIIAGVVEKDLYSQHELGKILKIGLLDCSIDSLCIMSRIEKPDNVEYKRIDNEWYANMHPFMSSIPAVLVAKGTAPMLFPPPLIFC